MEGGKPDRSRCGLARREALGRAFNAVVGAIAHQMRERILDQFQHLAVELGLGAAHLQVDVLVEFGAQIAHDARKLLPRIADRLHARLHHAFLQLGGDVRKPLQRHLEIGILVPAHDLKELIAREHQLGDRRHQIIERIDIDADRMTGDAIAALIVGPMGYGALSALRVARALQTFSRTGRRRRRRLCLLRQAAEIVDQVAIAAVRLLLLRFELVKDDLDAIDREKNDGDGLGGDRHAVAEFAHERFRGVGQSFETGQSKKAAGALDRMDEAKDVAEDFDVVRLALEAHELGVNAIEILVGLGQELAKQVVHEEAPSSPSALVRAAQASREIIAAKARNGARLWPPGTPRLI